jgi:hypothetical protein
MNRANARKLIDQVDFEGGVPIYFSRHATDTGLPGVGCVWCITSDFSGQSMAFFVQPEAGQVMRVFRMIGHLRDTGQFAAEKYGALAELANGVDVFVSYDSGASMTTLLNGHKAKSFSDWAAHCYDVDFTNYGTGDNFLNFRWTFAKGGVPIRLTEKDSIRVIANDNFEGLVDHQFCFQGYFE